MKKADYMNLVRILGEVLPLSLNNKFRRARGMQGFLKYRDNSTTYPQQNQIYFQWQGDKQLSKEFADQVKAVIQNIVGEGQNFVFDYRYDDKSKNAFIYIGQFFDELRIPEKITEKDECQYRYNIARELEIVDDECVEQAKKLVPQSSAQAKREERAFRVKYVKSDTVEGQNKLVISWDDEFDSGMARGYLTNLEQALKSAIFSSGEKQQDMDKAVQAIVSTTTANCSFLTLELTPFMQKLILNEKWDAIIEEFRGACRGIANRTRDVVKDLSNMSNRLLGDPNSLNLVKIGLIGEHGEQLLLKAPARAATVGLRQLPSQPQVGQSQPRRITGPTKFVPPEVPKGRIRGIGPKNEEPKTGGWMQKLAGLFG